MKKLMYALLGFLAIFISCSPNAPSGNTENSSVIKNASSLDRSPTSFSSYHIVDPPEYQPFPPDSNFDFTHTQGRNGELHLSITPRQQNLSATLFYSAVPVDNLEKFVRSLENSDPEDPQTIPFYMDPVLRFHKTFDMQSIGESWNFVFTNGNIRLNSDVSFLSRSDSIPMGNYFGAPWKETDFALHKSGLKSGDEFYIIFFIEWQHESTALLFTPLNIYTNKVLEMSKYTVS